MGKFRSLRRPLTLLAATLSLALLACPANAAWTMVHGDAANTNLARVVTQAVDGWPTAAHDIGSLGWDAGPVTAADGTVYVATLAGELHAFARDGTPQWRISLGGGLWSEASPAIGADGSIYVVGRRLERDERGIVDAHVQVLHMFSPTGMPLWRRGLPARLTPLLRLDQGIAHSAPKLWRHAGAEVVMLGNVHGIRRAEAATLLAFSAATGDLLGSLALGQDPDDHSLGTAPNAFTDVIDAIGDFWDSLSSFSATIPCGDWYDCRVRRALHDRSVWRVPEIGIKASRPGSSPEVVVTADVGTHLTRGFGFDPGTGFSPRWSNSERGRVLGGPPMLLSNRVAAVGVQTGDSSPWRVTIGGPDGPARPDVDALVYSAPTLLRDGRIALVSDHKLHVASANGWVDRVDIEGRSIVSAAASCSHLFVSTSRKLLTFDRRTLALTGELSILGGGTTGPAIGPFGDVHHAIQNFEGRTLLMFWPGPEQPQPGTAGPRLCQGDVAVPGLPVFGTTP